ncbi:MAG: HAD-IIB family hydrolase [Proteobacteria bacterium]|nr:HAD-IIB family hydrolase [Pseudomonadota bacterium]
MQPLNAFPVSAGRRIVGVFTDIDDTLSTEGRLTSEAYTALEALHDEGLIVVPITGRPAGWCDHIARMWPVDGVVGENGAFYFRYHRARRKMIRRFMQSATERAENRRRLARLRRRILDEVPGSALAADQHYRETDLAIDYCEDVERLGVEQVRRIVTLFEDAGATAKVSSIHVNGWFGDHDKLAMTRIMMAECFNIDLDEARERFVFVGDSPNDAPMFAYFPNAVGVANIRAFEAELPAPPAYVTEGTAGSGFAELAAALIEARK